MPPKKTVKGFEGVSEPTLTEPHKKETSEKPGPRRPAAHPSTAVMVKEALQALDSRKGVSSHAIQNYIKLKYTTVDLVKLKYLVRNFLKKGIESGTLVRPANSSSTAGAQGKFRLAPKVKQLKPKNENIDPNVQPASKVEKDQKPKKTGTTKMKDTGNEEKKTSEAVKRTKKATKPKEPAPSKNTIAKKPKAQTKAKDEEGSADSAPTKPVKSVKAVKPVRKPQTKATKAGSGSPTAKATGKRKKALE